MSEPAVMLRLELEDAATRLRGGYGGYGKFAKALLHFGKPYAGTERPLGYRRAASKQCFRNAARPGAPWEGHLRGRRRPFSWEYSSCLDHA